MREGAPKWRLAVTVTLVATAAALGLIAAPSSPTTGVGVLEPSSPVYPEASLAGQILELSPQNIELQVKLSAVPTQQALQLEETIASAHQKLGQNVPDSVSVLLIQAEEILAHPETYDADELIGIDEDIRSELLNEDLDAAFDGGEGAVTVTNPATGKVLFERDAERQFTSASTYKLFVMYDMLARMEDGKLSPSSRLESWSADECVDAMIIYSQNECPQEWMYQMGYPHMQQVADSVGAKNTVFEFGNLRTAPADLAEFLGRLYRGELLNEKSTERAIELMVNQEFRDGIPAGVGEDIVVADKVGWLDDVYHDAGIIYSPKGDFIMAIMTENLPVSALAEAAAAIYEWL